MHFSATMLCCTLIVIILCVCCVNCDVAKTKADFCGDDGASSLCIKMREIENLLHQQQAKISHQEGLLLQQGDQLRQQETTLRHQETTLRQQETTLRQQTAQIQMQNEKLVQQDETLQKFREEGLRDSRELEAVKSRLTVFEKFVTSYNIGVNTSMKVVASSAGVSRDVTRRSDDAGPLEAVMAQMSQKMTEMSADIQALKNSNVLQDQKISDGHQTSTYVHWGNSNCASDSTLLYAGVMGGSFPGPGGKGTNHICVTLSPVANNHTIPDHNTTLIGTEYETQDAHQDKDAVCAVCRSTYHNIMMIPGTNVCIQGWIELYNGYLMSGYYDDFICVDSVMKSSFSGDEDRANSAPLYFTIAECGSLPCEPYVNGTAVVCVVCAG